MHRCCFNQHSLIVNGTLACASSLGLAMLPPAWPLHRFPRFDGICRCMRPWLYLLARAITMICVFSPHWEIRFCTLPCGGRQLKNPRYSQERLLICSRVTLLCDWYLCWRNKHLHHGREIGTLCQVTEYGRAVIFGLSRHVQC